MLTQDIDEELILFSEIRRHEKSHQGSDNISSATTMSSQPYPSRRTAADNFLYSENEKSDYDWLVTPPGSPSKSLMNQLDAPDVINPMAIESRLLNFHEEERDKTSSKNKTIGLKRPSSSTSSRSASRPSTPTRRSSTRATRPTTPTTRATLTSSSTTSSRPSTPTSRPPSSSGTSRVTSTAARATLTSSSTSSSRPSTPTSRPSSSGTSRATSTVARATLASSIRSSRSTSRPSTPTERDSSSGASRANLTAARATTGSVTSTRPTRPISAPNSKPGSRSNTPTRRPSTPTGSSTISRSKPTKPMSIPIPIPTLRSRPWEPYEMPGFSFEAPSNLRTTLPDRPQTASSRITRAFGASSGSSSRSSSIERGVSRRSCSPSRNRASIGNVKGDVHVAKGNQKVERVVNTRKLASPRLTENGGRGGGDDGGSSAVKSRSRTDGFGFGRNLSKSSIDMALKHMDVKRGSMRGNFRPVVNKVPAASLYSVRQSGNRRNRPVSSSGSSESSVNILCLDGSDDNLSDISYS